MCAPVQCSNPGFAKKDILKKTWIWNLLHSHLDHGEAVQAEDVPGLQLPVGQRIVRAVRVETGLKGACYHKRRDLHGHLEPNPGVHEFCLLARFVGNVGLEVFLPCVILLITCCVFAILLQKSAVQQSFVDLLTSSVFTCRLFFCLFVCLHGNISFSFPPITIYLHCMMF